EIDQTVTHQRDDKELKVEVLEKKLETLMLHQSKEKHDLQQSYSFQLLEFANFLLKELLEWKASTEDVQLLENEIKQHKTIIEQFEVGSNNRNQSNLKIEKTILLLITKYPINNIPQNIFQSQFGIDLELGEQIVKLTETVMHFFVVLMLIHKIV